MAPLDHNFGRVAKVFIASVNRLAPHTFAAAGGVPEQRRTGRAARHGVDARGQGEPGGRPGGGQWGFRAGLANQAAQRLGDLLSCRAQRQCSSCRAACHWLLTLQWHACGPWS